MFYVFIYRMLTYVLMFGPTIKPLYHKMYVWPAPVSDRLIPRYRNKDLEFILFHNCSMNPDIVRQEVEVLKKDFNQRIKQILFNSLLTAYYMTFIPLCFAQVSYWYYRCFLFDLYHIYIYICYVKFYIEKHLLLF
jgi:hypothetical protein